MPSWKRHSRGVPDTPPRPPRRRRRLWWSLAVLAVIAALVPLGLWLLRPKRIDVTVDRRDVTIGAPFNAGHALRAAKRAWPRDGTLRAVVTRHVLDAHWNRSVVMVGRRPVSSRADLSDGARISVHIARDEVEPTVQRRVPVAAPGLPPVEHELWLPGAAGIADQVVGTHSGEVVHQTTVQAPVPASRMPGNVIALTFDDGPDPINTPQVLAILDRFHVKATFCIVGTAARKHPELITAIRAQGHALCDHTETHAYLDRIPVGEIAAQISGPADFSHSLTGDTLRFMRPPYGGINQSVLDISHKQGFRVLEWSVDPRDFESPPALAITGRVLAGVRPGRIVLMHDGGSNRAQTIAALPVIITQLQAQGYTFVQPVA